MITSDKINTLRECFLNFVYETSVGNNEYKLSDFISNESENDPNFFRWLFGKDFEDDFANDLSESEKNEFGEFLEDNELILSTSEDYSVVCDTTDPYWYTKDVTELKIYNLNDLHHAIKLSKDTSELENVQYYQATNCTALVVWNEDLNTAGWYDATDWDNFFEEYEFMF